MRTSTRQQDSVLILLIFGLEAVIDPLLDQLKGRTRSTLELRADSPDRHFPGWEAAGASERWARSSSSGITFEFPSSRGPIDVYLLELKGVGLGDPGFEILLDGRPLGNASLAPAPGSTARFLVDCQQLRGETASQLELVSIRREQEVPVDSRSFGFLSLIVRPAPTPISRVANTDDLYFGSGFSVAEHSWRWTDGHRARLHYPMNRPSRTLRYRLTISAGTTGKRTAEVWINDRSIGDLIYDGWGPTEKSLTFDGTLLRSGVNILELRLGDTFTAPGDDRELGLAIRWLSISPEEQGPAHEPGNGAE